VREGLSRPLWLAIIIGAFCIPLFVGLGRTDMQNDEAIYSYAVDGILATGDWLNPLSSPHEDTVFLEKPPLKFWIVAAPIALGLLPHDELGLRVWDALFGAVAFLYVFALGRRLAGPICGALAVFVLFAYGPLLFDHGLRNNNMEAPLVLSYCGGVYHYLMWASPDAQSRRRAHVAAVMLYFFLGFMTKFVAVLFLPIVLGAATVLHRATLRKLVAEWRLWAAMALIFVALAAPWFVYQYIQQGPFLVRVMFTDHVYTRFTAVLDPSHAQPWNYYYAAIFNELQRTRTDWLAIVGGVLLLTGTLRDRSLEKVLVVAWFVCPLALMALGTSKLHHYAYPFLPPIALAAGYGPAWLSRVGRRPVDAAMDAIHGRLIAARSWSGGMQMMLLALAAVAVGIGLATVVLGSVTLEIRGVKILRNSRVVRPLVVALVLATLAGRGAIAARVLLPMMLLVVVVPVKTYEIALIRALQEDHPMRSARDCLLKVRAQELAAGRHAPGIYTVSEQKWMLHSHFYYFRRLGKWERGDTLDDRVVADGLFVSGEQRPIIIGDADYQTFKVRYRDALVAIPMLRLREALLLMPGPYALCAPQLTPLTPQ